MHYDGADKWDIRFLKLAREISQWSKDPSTKTGAVIVDLEHRVIGTGYNGFAPGVLDTEERLNDRQIKYKMVIHAEVNAMILAERSIKGLGLYLWPFMPCSNCTAIMIRAGIKRCVAPQNENPRWKDDFVLTRIQFREAKVELLEITGYF